VNWIRSIGSGFLRGRGKAVATLLFFGSAWLFSTLALRPMSVGLHRALDEAPAAKDFLSSGGIDLWVELLMRQPASVSGGLSLLLPMLALYALLGLYLTAGLYGFAASQEGHVWRAFFERARRFFVPFALGFLMNLVFWALVTGIFALGAVGLGRVLKDATDPAVQWRLFLMNAVLLSILLNYFRGSVGFFQARYALTEGREGLGRCFLGSLSFAFKRLIPVNALTWFFTVLHVLVLWLAVFALSPGYATAGKWVATALLLQAGYLALAFLRVAEARSQVEYTRGFLASVNLALKAPAEEAVQPDAPSQDSRSAEVSEGTVPPGGTGATEVDSGVAGT
jgi:hypothetical protein